MSDEPGTSSATAEIIERAAQFGGHVLRERLRRPIARTAGDVPVARASLTTAWLTAVLCSEVAGAEVIAFETEDVSSGTSTRWRLRVSYNTAGTEAGLPTRLFAKTSASLKQRLILSLTGVLDGETRFFGELRPHLEIEAPQAYHAALDARSGRSISLLEDLSETKGASFCGPVTTVSRGQIQDLLSSMATWHGRHWANPALAAMPWLKTPSQWFANADRLVRWERRAEVGVKRARSVIPDALAEKQVDIYRALERSLELATSGTRTLLHGDPHVGNTYVTADGRMGYTDWQIVMQGLWAYDYAYAVNTTLTIEDRREWENELLAFYLERLAAAGGEALDYDTAWLCYRQQSLYPYAAWLGTHGHSVIQPKYQPDEVCLRIIERTGQAVLDLDAVGAVAHGSAGASVGITITN